MRARGTPTQAQRHLRDLTRYRTHLIEEGARLANRQQAVLEDINIKVASVLTDIRGVSARAIREALIAGEADASQLADLARGRLRAKRDAPKQETQRELGANYFDEQARHSVERCLVRRFERFGYAVTLQPTTASQIVVA